jgi:hypothetical protein
MNSIVSEKRIRFYGLPLLVIALCVFYVLGAAALVAQAVKSGELASTAAAHSGVSLVVTSHDA